MNSPCTAVNFNADGKLTVTWPNEHMIVDHVISGIPAQTLANVLPKDCGELASELKNIQSTTVGVVNLEYEGSVVPMEGFGYLVPSSEPLQVLGIIFDSCAFPENDRGGGKTTRLTVSINKIEFLSLVFFKLPSLGHSSFEFVLDRSKLQYHIFIIFSYTYVHCSLFLYLDMKKLSINRKRNQCTLH